MSNATRTLALLALGVSLAACSSSGGSTPTTDAPSATVDREDYAQRLAEWLCDDLAACCESSGESVDRATCVEVKRKAELHRVASEESHGVRAFDGAVAAECVAALGETPAACGSERRVRRCFQTYDGVAGLGDACGGKIQCRGSVSGDVACIEGRCTERLPAGEACADRPDDRGRCDVCRGDARCREATDGNHYCYGYEHRRRGVAGDPCVKDRTVQPPDPTQTVVLADCDLADGLRCSADGVCVAFAVGDACRSFIDCGAGARCESGACVPGLPAGETCTSRFDCGGGLYCQWNDVVCVERHPVTNVCLQEDLVSGVCAVPSREGAACGRHVRCADGLVCPPTNPSGDGQCVAVNDSLCSFGRDKLARQASKVN